MYIAPQSSPPKSEALEADPSKVSKVLAWPCPKSASDVRCFLGLVKFITHFLPDLTNFTSILYPLTMKACDKLFPPWSLTHQVAFDGIKHLVTSSCILTTINHDNPGTNKIFVTCNASLKGMGAVLSWGPSWKESRPVAFDSQVYHGPEHHYPTHEQELLAIIRALGRWRSDLIGMHFKIFMDHKTLLNFDMQKDLSQHQAWWMEFLSQYDYKIHYVNGALNVAADVLSQIDPPSLMVLPTVSNLVMAATCLSDDPFPLSDTSPFDTDDLDLFCLPSQFSDPPQFHVLAATARLDLSSSLLDDFKAGYALDTFAKKLLSSLQSGSHHTLGVTLENSLLSVKGRLYVPHHANLLAIDFVGLLPLNDSFNYLATFTDHLGADIKLVPCCDDMTAEDFACLFLDHWYCDNRCLKEIVSDRDHLFTSKFWEAFTSLLNVKRLMSSSFHPETDGASECTNKTVALPHVHFNIMNSVNASTGLLGFQLKSGHSPKVLPPSASLPASLEMFAGDHAHSVVQDVKNHCTEAQDNLLAAKIVQAHYANEHCSIDPSFAVGLGCVAKFMPHFDGPFEVIKAHPEMLSYTLQLPACSRIHPTFHVSQLKHFSPNNPLLFPDRVNEEPGLILTDDGNWEHVVDRILDERKRCGKSQYLVWWKGFGPDHDEWLGAEDLKDNKALDQWGKVPLFS
ncbi:hypothetical protein NP233_g6221 [Leucocoprinus birnbaumii]|uniref:Chromo domain-containing protein n=1 Tax=Leucocoprinus birnbaumii TaxID=56174 RepID=A0AAD5YQ77_9AGAR|nr:hypothetical protein NP233_g6221 [Leucocoprinus birnbaumii]